MLNIKTIVGDITKEKSDGLITAINSAKMWFGGIDRAIMSVASTHFHDQAKEYPLKDGDVIFAEGKNETNFKNVIFSLDDAQRPVREVVLAGLLKAEAFELEKVTIPAIRLGLARGMYEKTDLEVITGYKESIIEFMKKRESKNIKEIVFVNYEKNSTSELMEQEFLSL